MTESIKKYFPAAIESTNPEGGMFLWITLPDGTSSMKLFNRAIKDNVAFVPGLPFYINRSETNTFRLNFSCVDELTIETGIERLGKAIREELGS